ncbi:helix-turn-helix domain-containing protein [Mycolicibacterium sp. CBMA 226]|uniref:winged helix-turn-helix transcriptional regulator n=1 Tax=Mycolicibacterium sp. CBMA 226 TaxID=2606611 RepID=UPI0012DFE8DF|nr:helix-turn-helix domain-containing protein [Mycolicibacterium sp. CBMA 226]MUL74539.1 helix-turn-helix transcriptional regulator [Mycolicibacterium sp. CBMA 226]
MAVHKTYSQNCPVALGMDVLGERWTMLILRELFGGPRRYSDLRAELPGIATNLLADRLRSLELDGLVRRTDLPPPIARTVYELSDTGWRKVAPVLRAVAIFGIDRIDADDLAERPLTGFLAGLVAGFDSAGAGDVAATYRVEVNGRIFELSVDHGELAPPRDAPAVVMQATADDLIAIRAAPTATRRKAALRRLKFDGDPTAVAEMRRIFHLAA